MAEGQELRSIPIEATLQTLGDICASNQECSDHSIDITTPTSLNSSTPTSVFNTEPQMASIPAGSGGQHGLCSPSPEGPSDGLGAEADTANQVKQPNLCEQPVHQPHSPKFVMPPRMAQSVKNHLRKIEGLSAPHRHALQGHRTTMAQTVFSMRSQIMKLEGFVHRNVQLFQDIDGEVLMDDNLHMPLQAQVYPGHDEDERITIVCSQEHQGKAGTPQPENEALLSPNTTPTDHVEPTISEFQGGFVWPHFIITADVLSDLDIPLDMDPPSTLIKLYKEVPSKSGGSIHIRNNLATERAFVRQQLKSGSFRLIPIASTLNPLVSTCDTVTARFAHP
ncbi:uncharacterized protein LACBIDRAFT_329321 [Laccaria bicolor S238N-H82]|uniref:Predicted protein n=1 Tax=Laccaria bicolor (strain S238N-H82 / ATCC MYA-4686) TaxID=486041 RepID=B0DHN8_LACBS|nr:uncharacterized protein LACBIDRAFT_329321 [Laccaria bicolor S238N-H82]EDR05867.1 predicted protein [Laccaria bicolor S238N-H82]|eukprot:XP_001883543.1 predicted protein [Laccaria bicolor S238N-H82]